MTRLFLLVAALLVSGCAANSYCLEDQNYQKAQSVPAIRAADGLTIPDSPSALRIPPAGPSTEPYGKKVKDEKGDERIVCLDRPPVMPPLAPLPEPATPPPAVPAAPVPADTPAEKPAS